MTTPTGPRLDPQRLILTVALVALALLWLVPVVWVLVTSLKLSENIVRLPPEWIPWPATGQPLSRGPVQQLAHGPHRPRVRQQPRRLASAP